jgi:hypothetical protein
MRGSVSSFWVSRDGSNEVCEKQWECGNEERSYEHVKTRDRLGVMLIGP